MQISTGLHPRVSRVAKPGHPVSVFTPEHITSIPSYGLNTAWLLELCESREDGVVTHPVKFIVGENEPVVARKGAKFAATNSPDYNLTDAEAYYRRTHQVPEDAVRTVHRLDMYDLLEIEFSWYVIEM